MTHLSYHLGSTLITGGLGSLGLLVACWLAQAYDKNRFKAVLIGRTGSTSMSAALHSLSVDISGSLQIHRCDIGCREEVNSLVQTCHRVSILQTLICQNKVSIEAAYYYRTCELAADDKICVETKNGIQSSGR